MSETDGDTYMEMAAVSKLQYALKVKQINEELLEYFASSIRWLIHYSEKNRIDLPDKERLLLTLE
ncbi:MAG: hypothetical protein ACRD5H_03060, partial [Nitrososphaerales archaeon]